MYQVSPSSDYKLLVSERYMLLTTNNKLVFVINVMEEAQAFKQMADSVTDGGVIFDQPNQSSSNASSFFTLETL